jgi:hypothetical protein
MHRSRPQKHFDNVSFRPINTRKNHRCIRASLILRQLPMVYNSDAFCHTVTKCGARHSYDVVTSSFVVAAQSGGAFQITDIQEGSRGPRLHSG